MQCRRNKQEAANQQLPLSGSLSCSAPSLERNESLKTLTLRDVSVFGLGPRTQAGWACRALAVCKIQSKIGLQLSELISKLFINDFGIKKKIGIFSILQKPEDRF